VSAAQRPIELVCIACPIGCRLTVAKTGEGALEVTGNKCPKGEAYGKEEVLSPKRVLTAVVRTDSADFPFAPVRTDAPLPRSLIPELLSELSGREVRLPIALGARLVADFKGTGVNVVCTRSLPPAGFEPEPTT
jgi:CxxC motif-containing protein